VYLGDVFEAAAPVRWPLAVSRLRSVTTDGFDRPGANIAAGTTGQPPLPRCAQKVDERLLQRGVLRMRRRTASIHASDHRPPRDQASGEIRQLAARLPPRVKRGRGRAPGRDTSAAEGEKGGCQTRIELRQALQAIRRVLLCLLQGRQFSARCGSP